MIPHLLRVLWLSNCCRGRRRGWPGTKAKCRCSTTDRSIGPSYARVEPAAPPPPPSPRPIKAPTGSSYGAHDADHSDGLQGPPDGRARAGDGGPSEPLCDVAEAMRGVDGSSRPARLRKELEALPRRTPLAHAPFEKAGRLEGVARVPPREGHVFKTKARAPALVLLETVDDPDADTTCLREEDSESDDEKPSRRMTPAQNHPVCLPVSFLFPICTPSTRRPAQEFAIEECIAPARATLWQPRRSSPTHPEEPPTDDDSTTSADLAGDVNDDMLPTPSQSQELTGDQLKRVTSVPSIVECSYGADDAATGDVKQAAQSPPPRRNTSSTGLDTLAEADTPLDGEGQPSQKSRRDAWIRRK